MDNRKKFATYFIRIFFKMKNIFEEGGALGLRVKKNMKTHR
jgi:hypothetical protein